MADVTLGLDPVDLLIKVVKGDAPIIPLTIKSNATGLVVDITGYSFTMTVTDPSGSTVFTSSGTITDATGGLVEFRLTTANTNQTAGVYRHEMVLVDNASNPLTFADGALLIVDPPDSGTLVVEDGNGVLNANSYGSVTEYTTYWKNRGTIPTEEPSVIQANLIKATDYIDRRFGRSLRGQRAFDNLASRSVLTFTGQPLDTETITVGSVVYTFKTTPVSTNDIEIGNNLYQSLQNLVASLGSVDNDDFLSTVFNGVDTVHIFTEYDGVTTTETLTNGSFDVAASQGYSNFPQSLEFPRRYLYDRTSGLLVEGIPNEIKYATFEYAKRAISSDLWPDPSVDDTGVQVVKLRDKVGPLETEKIFNEFKSGKTIRPYPTADALVRKYTIQGGYLFR